MPIYEYVCDDCGFDFERAQSFHDEPLSTCPECEGTVRRVISPVGIIFKGSGWYITDSRRQISTSAGTEDRATETATVGEAEANGGGASEATEATEAPAKASETTSTTNGSASKGSDKPATGTKKKASSSPAK